MLMSIGRERAVKPHGQTRNSKSLMKNLDSIISIFLMFEFWLVASNPTNKCRQFIVMGAEDGTGEC